VATYAVEMNMGTTHTTNAAGAVYCPASSQRRIKIGYLSYGSEATPADTAFLIQVARSTTAPTITSVTPKPVDLADAACVTLAGENSTANGTLTSGEIMLSTPLNQKATFQWYAPPGKPIIIPATASYGVHFLTPTTTGTAALTITCWFDE